MSIDKVIPIVVLILVEAIKRADVIEKRWLPFVSLAVGLIIGTIFAFVDEPQTWEHIVNGFIYGAAAAGLYDAGKSALEGKAFEN